MGSQGNEYHFPAKTHFMVGDFRLGAKYQTGGKISYFLFRGVFMAKSHVLNIIVGPQLNSNSKQESKK